MMMRRWDRRGGNVAVIVAASLIAIMGAVALSLDGGQQLDKRRSAYGAADAAALTAASELYANWWGVSPHGTDTAEGHAALLAGNVAKKNGFENGVNGCTVLVDIPPATGPFAGQTCHAEVRITQSQPRFFSKVWGSSNVDIYARAVARGKRTRVNNGIIVLDPDDPAALTASGNGLVSVASGAALLVNSSDPGAVVVNGQGGTTNVTDYYSGNTGSIDVVGVPGYTINSGTIGATFNSGVDPTPDPLRFLPPPDPSTLPVRSTKKLQYSSATNLTIKAGLYIGGISISGKGNVFMEPGIYYMQGGGFTVGAQGSLTGYNVMIYNDPQSNSDAISITGSGAITLTPPDSGPYQGILLFQSRDSIYQPVVKVTGSPAVYDADGNQLNKMTMTGTFYVPSAELDVTGNGSNDVIGSQYISNTLKLAGNGTFKVDWNPDIIPGIREIYLVE